VDKGLLPLLTVTAFGCEGWVMPTPAEALTPEQLLRAREHTAAKRMTEAKLAEYESVCVLGVGPHVQAARDAVHAAIDAQLDAYETCRVADMRAGQI
jgi:hypothetical protein